MGTRHLIAVFIDGMHKVAQYGQWDGYPEGVGHDLLSFLRETNLETLKEQCRKCRFLTEEECDSVNLIPNWKKSHPHLSRDTSWEVLPMILKAPDGLKLVDQLSFAADSIFCEWAYVVDFDKGSFEVFKGFNKQPLQEFERFSSMIKEGAEYQPVRLQKLWPLNELPTAAEFLATFKSEDEE